MRLRACTVAALLWLCLGAGIAASPRELDDDRRAEVADRPGGLDTVPALAGRWVNEKGSEMVLDLEEDGSLTGRYRSAVGRVSPNDWYPLSGLASGDQVGFCVNWARPSGSAKPAASVTCMVGEHTRADGKEELRLTWLLERNVPDDRENAELWSAVSTGASVYRRPQASAGRDPARGEP